MTANNNNNDDPKTRMLAALDEIRRKVETGEVTGVILGAMRKDDYFLSWVKGEPPGPHAILVLESYLQHAKHIFLDENLEDNDGAPMLGVPDPSEPT